MWMRRFASGFRHVKKAVVCLPAIATVGTGLAFCEALNNFCPPIDLEDSFCTSKEDDDNTAHSAPSISASTTDGSASLPIMGSGKWHEVTKAATFAPLSSYPTWAAHLLRGIWRVDTAAIAANNPMEDRIVVEPCGDGILCGVFDGHYGPRLSEFGRKSAREMFTRAIEEEAKAGNKDSALAMRRYFALVEEAWTQAAKRLIVAGDWTPAMEGACAVMAYITADSLVVGNLGDSRAILVRQEQPGGELTLEQLTNEHNVRDPKERAKLQAEHPNDEHAARYIREAKTWYVCGLLQVTRSLGDLFLKKLEYFQLVPADLKPPDLCLETFKPPYVSADPEIISRRLDSNDLFLVIATDGLWDELQNPEVMKILAGRPVESYRTQTDSWRRTPQAISAMASSATTDDVNPRKLTAAEFLRELEDRAGITLPSSLLTGHQQVAKEPIASLEHVTFESTSGGAGAVTASHLTVDGAMHDCRGPACAASITPGALTNAAQRVLWGALRANKVSQRYGVEQLMLVPQGRGRRQVHDDISVVVVLLRPIAPAAVDIER